MDITKLQKETSSKLGEHLLHHAVLAAHCPLDYGHHTISPRANLGTLSKLSTEIQQAILGDLDIKSLLTFRSVNQRAVDVIDGMIEYQKVRELLESNSASS